MLRAGIERGENYQSVGHPEDLGRKDIRNCDNAPKWKLEMYKKTISFALQFGLRLSMQTGMEKRR